MIYKMRRQDRALSDTESLSILKAEKYGVLSLTGANDRPYGVPLHYVIIDNYICFHCSAAEGHKKDALKTNNQVCFTVIQTQNGIQCKSVLIFGTAEADPALAEPILTRLIEKFVPQIAWQDAKAGIPAAKDKITAYRIKPQSITGKWIDQPSGGKVRKNRI